MTMKIPYMSKIPTVFSSKESKIYDPINIYKCIINQMLMDLRLYKAYKRVLGFIYSRSFYCFF